MPQGCSKRFTVTSSTCILTTAYYNNTLHPRYQAHLEALEQLVLGKVVNVLEVRVPEGLVREYLLMYNKTSFKMAVYTWFPKQEDALPLEQKMSSKCAWYIPAYSITIKNMRWSILRLPAGRPWTVSLSCTCPSEWSCSPVHSVTTIKRIRNK